MYGTLYHQIVNFCTQTFNHIYSLVFIFEVYYGIVFICTFLGQLLVASVSLLSRSLCFIAYVVFLSQ